MQSIVAPLFVSDSNIPAWKPILGLQTKLHSFAWNFHHRWQDAGKSSHRLWLLFLLIVLLIMVGDISKAAAATLDTPQPAKKVLSTSVDSLSVPEASFESDADSASPAKHSSAVATTEQEQRSLALAMPGAGNANNTGRSKFDPAQTKHLSGHPKRSADEELLNQSILAKEESLSKLSSGAQEVAKDLKLLPNLSKLLELALEPARKRTIDYLLLRQNISQTLILSYFEEAGTVATLDEQIDRTARTQDDMEDSRDRAVRYNTIANFTEGGALSMLASGVQIGTPNAWQNSGNELEVIQGGIQTMMSAYALKQSRGGKWSSPSDQNMLAQIFDRPVPPDRQFSDLIWMYLNDPLPPSNISRRDLLIQKWILAKRLHSPNTKAGQRDIDMLTGSIAARHSITIELLKNRRIMLEELKYVITGISRDLLEIMKTYQNT